MFVLKNLKLIGLLTDASPVTTEQIERAYEDFTAQVVTPDPSETDYSAAFRRLNYVQ